jgi:hypothetical protein
LQEKLAGSHLYGDNKMLGARVKIHLEVNDIFRKVFGNVPDRWLFNDTHAVVEKSVRGKAQGVRSRSKSGRLR